MKKKIKCLHLVYSGLGGAGNVVLSLIEADKKKKINHSVFFVGNFFLKDYKKKCNKFGIKHQWIKTKNISLFSAFILAYKKIKKNKPDVILINNFYLIPCIFYKLFFKGVKLIYVNHKPINLLDWKDMLMKNFSYFIDKFIFLNKKSIAYALNYMNISSKKLSLITNGINIDFFKPTSNRKKNKIFRIGMACRINKSKCYDLIAESLNSQLLKNYKIEFSLVGNGEDLDNFKNKIKNMKLENKIKVEGYMNENNLKKWYNNLNLYVQASRGEGMSISLIQAMSMRVPSIGSAVSGIEDLLKKNNGILFQNNIKDLSEKILYFYFLKKKKKLEYTSKQRQHIVNNYNYLNMFEKYYLTITNILSNQIK